MMPAKLSRQPWITKDGYMDLTEFPIDGVLKQVMSGERNKVRNGLRFLAAVQQAGRREAGIFLLGFLLDLPPDDLETRQAAVEALETFHTAGCAAALFGELRRVKSSNATRRYLARILEALSRFPRQLVASEFHALIEDPRFSCKMKARFREQLERMEYNGTE